MKIEIEYCVPCGYLPRATEAQTRLLEEFGDRIESVALKTGSKGVFTFRADGDVIYSKPEEFDIDAIVADRGAAACTAARASAEGRELLMGKRIARTRGAHGTRSRVERRGVDEPQGAFGSATAATGKVVSPSRPRPRRRPSPRPRRRPTPACARLIARDSGVTRTGRRLGGVVHGDRLAVPSAIYTGWPGNSEATWPSGPKPEQQHVPLGIAVCGDLGVVRRGGVSGASKSVESPCGGCSPPVAAMREQRLLSLTLVAIGVAGGDKALVAPPHVHAGPVDGLASGDGGDRCRVRCPRFRR